MSEVLVVASKDEIKKSVEFTERRVALKRMMEDLEARYLEYVSDHRSFWDEVRVKYDLTGKHLLMNNETGEITRVE